MAEKKMTKKEKFALALDIINGKKEPSPEEVVLLNEFFDHEVELLSAKSSKGNAKKSEEQEQFMDIIRDVLAEASDANGMTNAQMLEDERIKDFPWKDGKVPTSASRLTSYLTKMGEPDEKHPDRLGDIKRTVVKKVPYFSLA